MTSNPPPPQDPRDGGEQPPPPPSYPSYPPYQQTPQGMPGYPGGAGGPVTPAERPTSIERAVLLMRAGAGLALVTLVVGLLTLGDVKDNIRQQLVDNNDFTQSKLDTAYNIAIVGTIVVGLIAIAIWLLMAYANGAGRKWARIIATVLGVLSILSFLATAAQAQQTAVGIVLSGITAVLAIVILILLWNKESSAYYNGRSRRQLS